MARAVQQRRGGLRPYFKNGDSFDTVASPGGKDGLNFNANVGVGPYSVVILSQ
jgi:1,4-alpha-glucan branching enzyme